MLSHAHEVDVFSHVYTLYYRNIHHSRQCVRYNRVFCPYVILRSFVGTVQGITLNVRLLVKY